MSELMGQDTSIFENYNISYWLDEAEINFGDSLIDKISKGVYESDLIIAIISKTSVKSNWVQKELQMAMTREVSNNRIHVLPIVIASCTKEMPYYLQDKLYADFRDPQKYSNNINKLLNSIENNINKPHIINTNNITTDRRDSKIDQSQIGNIGNIIHDREEGFRGFRTIKIIQKQITFRYSLGLGFTVASALLVKLTTKIDYVIVVFPGLLIILSALIMMLEYPQYRTAFQRNRQLLYIWEEIGDPGFFFSKKWRELYKKGKSESCHSLGLILGRVQQIISILAILAILAMAIYLG